MKNCFEYPQSQMFLQKSQTHLANIRFPQFMYYLRRSQFLQTFNASPDETAYNRAILSRESIDNAMTMIQPALMQYSAEYRDGLPVLLDSQSLKPDVVLMLDSFFHLVVWEGETVLSWKQQGYLDNPEYAHIREMLENPEKLRKQMTQKMFNSHQNLPI
jgi:protein transport protein SEC23